MMQPFGHYIMRSRRHAGLIALLFASLPLLNWVSVIIMALVTLRRGAQEGFYILLCVILPTIVWFVISKNANVLLNIALSVVVVWLLAIVLHRTHNWNWVILAGVMLGIIAIIALHAYIPDINQWWLQKMSAYLQTAGSEMQINVDVQQVNLNHIAKIATGLQAAAVLLINLLWLLVARYWQALLYNPGKLRGELQAIRLPKWTSVILMLLGLLAWWDRLPVLMDIMPLLLLAYTLAGLSLVHYLLFIRHIAWFWLIVFYAILIFALPYVVVALVMMAMTDSWMNLRSRLQIKK